MKQIIQNLKNGDTILEEVPVPKVTPGHVLIKSTRSLVSLGTERNLVEFGKANYIDKARQQPDKVKMVRDKIKTDGLGPTIESVTNKLNQPMPLGYCNVGRVIAVGEGVTEYKIGDRVASNGPHAEFVNIPKNLTAKVPKNVSDDEAAFTVIGAIAIQGIRLAKPTFGETIVVMGLGLIGLITAQLLKANGCKVVGFDFDEEKIHLAKSKGIHAVNINDTDSEKLILELTNDIGADAVLITASSSSHDIIHQAAIMSRKKGRIVLVGVIGLNLIRDDFYKKELTFQVSCSYGPGRYEEEYELKGNDYPIGYVRWTQKRNFEAILHAMSSKQLDVNPLITERVGIEEYQKIYDDMRRSGSIASLIIYKNEPVLERTINVSGKVDFAKTKGNIGILGAGNFTSSTVLPALKNSGAVLKYIASAKGLSSKNLAKRFGVAISTTDPDIVKNDKDVNLVLITTRHNQHAEMTMDFLKAGKHVFVEKPLALTYEELIEIEKVYNKVNSNRAKKLFITVGFNRRFAPLAVKMKQLLGNNDNPININATMNAGFMPNDMWHHDMKIGGGRIIGEACHYIDLCTYLTGSKVSAVCMNAMGINPEENTDNASILLRYENGSNAVINYFSNGSKSYKKEEIEVFSQGKVLVLDNWRKLIGYGWKGFRSKRNSQDKGHKTQFKNLIENLKEGKGPIIPFDEILNTSKASIAAVESLREKNWIKVN